MHTRTQPHEDGTFTEERKRRKALPSPPPPSDQIGLLPRPLRSLGFLLDVLDLRSDISRSFLARVKSPRTAVSFLNGGNSSTEGTSSPRFPRLFVKSAGITTLVTMTRDVV